MLRRISRITRRWTRDRHHLIHNLFDSGVKPLSFFMKKAVRTDRTAQLRLLEILKFVVFTEECQKIIDERIG